MNVVWGLMVTVAEIELRHQDTSFQQSVLNYRAAFLYKYVINARKRSSNWVSPRLTGKSQTT
ncbi:MAG: hypothetical protein LH628_02945 [Microcoleus sp. CAN_BIN18]|nr:hypothetical protein [Microcoleus sp. CAN_BIN18]